MSRCIIFLFSWERPIDRSISWRPVGIFRMLTQISCAWGTEIKNYNNLDPFDPKQTPSKSIEANSLQIFSLGQRAWGRRLLITNMNCLVRKIPIRIKIEKLKHRGTITPLKKLLFLDFFKRATKNRKTMHIQLIWKESSKAVKNQRGKK